MSKIWIKLTLITALITHFNLAASIHDRRMHPIEERCLIEMQTQSIASSKTLDKSLPKLGYSSWQAQLSSLNLLFPSYSPITKLSTGIKFSNINFDHELIKKSEHCHLFVDGTHQLNLDLPFAVNVQGHLEFGNQLKQIALRSMAKFSVILSKSIQGHELSVGFYQEFGRRSYLTLPILGLKSSLSDSLRLDFLLPFYAKLELKANHATHFYAALRSLKDREFSHANFKDHNLTKSIWEYKAYTAALGVNYAYQQLAIANVELGQSLNPQVRIYDYKGKARSKIEAKSSLFAQINLSFIF
jgi:hypothetical protein